MSRRLPLTVAILFGVVTACLVSVYGYPLGIGLLTAYGTGLLVGAWPRVTR